MLKKGNIQSICSGGQIGVDQAALQAAKDSGIPTCGWAPKGFQTKRGNDPSLKEKYNLKESHGGYRVRTRQNVKFSNATLRLAYSFSSFGEQCTARAIADYGRPSLDINLKEVESIMGREQAAKSLHKFLAEQCNKAQGPIILNVAGNSGSVNDNSLYLVAYIFLLEFFKGDQQCQS